MLFYIWLPIIIATISFIYVVYDEHDSGSLVGIGGWLLKGLKGLCIACIIGSLAFIVGSLALLGVSSLLKENVETLEVLEWVEPIKSVGDNIGIQVKGFVLGTGYVENSLEYYYIKETDKGDIVGHVNAENCYLQESDKPTLEKYVYEFKNKAWYLIAEPRYSDYYIMKLPKDTVKYSYNIDLQ